MSKNETKSIFRDVKKLNSQFSEFCKRHEQAIFLGMDLMALETKVTVLLSDDDNYKKEVKDLNVQYSKDLQRIRERYIERYIKAGLL